MKSMSSGRRPFAIYIHGSVHEPPVCTQCGTHLVVVRRKRLCTECAYPNLAKRAERVRQQRRGEYQGKMIERKREERRAREGYREALAADKTRRQGL